MKIKNAVLVSVASVAVMSLLLLLGVFSNINLKVSDGLYGGKKALNNIAIVAIDDYSLQEIGRWPWDRSIIAKAIGGLSEAKVIGIDVAFFEEGSDEEDEALENALRGANTVIPLEYLTFKNVAGKTRGDRVLLPIENLEGIKMGYINVVTDNDGITRAINNDLSAEYESFASVIYKESWGKDAIKKQRLLINYAGSPEKFRTYSIFGLINGSTERADFKNKIVLIGATAPDLHDSVFVPTSNGKAMAGVEVHANALQMMINEDYLNVQGNLSIFAIMLAGSLAVSLVFWRYKTMAAMIFMVILIGAYIFIAIKVFDYGIIMNLIYVPLTLFLTFTGQAVSFYASERKSKAQIKEAFSKYVSKNVVEEILKDTSKLKLGGDKEEITVFFSDIRGFTTISENMKPEELVHFMNEYLSAMTRIILKHNGVVDKYIGDAIMAFWGAPIKIKNHAEVACKTSLDMLEELKKLNERWQKEGYPEIKIGIGLNTGEAIIGNMGSYERFDYTAMGDTINLGSRLESQTKEFGAGIIISEATKKAVGDKFKTKSLGKVKIKGKNKEVNIYELVGRKE